MRLFHAHDRHVTDYVVGPDDADIVALYRQFQQEQGEDFLDWLSTQPGFERPTTKSVQFIAQESERRKGKE